MSLNQTIKIGTHDGLFQCDEVLAIFLLKLLPRYKDAVIIRSRNQNILDSCDIVVDVGKKYDPSNHRYDHHMKNFNVSFCTLINKPGCDSKIKLSSAGLIYCHFGEEILNEILPKDTTDAAKEAVFRTVYYKLIREIDAMDNGIPMYDIEPHYYIATGIFSRVSRLNPAWNDTKTDLSEQFRKAIDLVGEEFLYCVNNAINVWWPARCIVENALLKRFEVDESGEIIELDVPAPWHIHLSALEEQYNIKPIIKYVLFYDDRDKSHRVRAVPVKPQGCVCRLFLPKSWSGLKGSNLDEVTGINGCIFVHPDRFMAGHRTREGSIEMARKALDIGKCGRSEDA